MITLVDYGLGNIRAFETIYRRLNIPVSVASTPEELESAERIVLPGVGAFDWAMEKLNASGMRYTLDELVLEKKRPILGVCVGMQIMADRSDEGELPGLGWIDAEVNEMNVGDVTAAAPLPHMGWNDVVPTHSHMLFAGISSPRYYFLHSFQVVLNDTADILAETGYIGTFASAVNRDNIYGTQFHPEKSHHWGISLLKNFAEI